jgi:hypothetical protein
MSLGFPKNFPARVAVLANHPPTRSRLPTCSQSGFISFGIHNSVFYGARSLATRPTRRGCASEFRLYPPEAGWPSYTPRHRVPILVVSYDTHGLRWGCSFPRPPHVKFLTNYIIIINTLYDWGSFPRG